MNIKEVQEKVQNWSNKLFADDPNWRFSVCLITKEGSSYFVRDSFLRRVDKFIAIIPEHGRVLVFPEDDIASFQQYEPITNPPGYLTEQNLDQ